MFLSRNFLQTITHLSVFLKFLIETKILAALKNNLHTQNFPKVNPTLLFFHSSRECTLCVCPLLVPHCDLKDVVTVLGLP